MAILCEPHGQTASTMLAALPSETRAVPTLHEAVLALAAEPNEHLVIVGPDVPLETVVDFARQVRQSNPELAVVMVRWAMDGARFEAAQAEGIEVVPAGDHERLADVAAQLPMMAAPLPRHQANADDVPAHPQHPSPHAHDAMGLDAVGLEAVGLDPRAHEVMPNETVAGQTGAQEPGRRGELITVFSAKGGCGKTTLATNLAVTLSSAGSTRVCLVDLDMDFGDVAISLQLTPRRTLADAADPQLGGRFADQHARLEGLTVSYAPSLDCVLAPAEPGEGDRVSTALVTALLEDLRSRYDYIVVDTPSHFSEHVLAALDATDFYVLVTTPEIPSLKNLRLTLDMFDLLGYDRQKRLIVFNRSDDQTGLTAADIEATIKTPITAHVPSSRDVPVSINKGVPLAQSQPRHDFSVAIRAFVAKAITHETTSRGGRLFSRRKPVRSN